MASFVVPSTLLTQLQAVNLLLNSLGQTGVNTYDPPPTPTVADALNALNEADLDIQSKGWHWNREYSFPLTLDGSSYVALPDQTLRVTNAYASPGGIALDITQRGTKLYDLTNHTYVFPAAPVVDLVMRLDWDLLPQVARAAIAYQAAYRFQARKQGTGVVLQVNQADVLKALTLLEQHEDETAGANAVNGSVHIVSALYGVGGMRRLRGGY